MSASHLAEGPRNTNVHTAAPVQPMLPNANAAPNTCGFTSALSGSLPYQQICWIEMCPNRMFCQKHHLSLFAAPTNNTFLQQTVMMQNSGISILNPGVGQQSFGLVPSIPRVPAPTPSTNAKTWKDTLRLAISARQLQKQTAGPFHVDSGHDSGVEVELSPGESKIGSTNSDEQGDESASPKSSNDGSSSGCKSPHSNPAHLASIALRNEDGQLGSSSSRGSSPLEKPGRLTPPSTDPDSDGSSKSPRLTQLKSVGTSLGFSVNHLLNRTQSDPELRPADPTLALTTPPHLLPQGGKLNSFGVSNPPFLSQVSRPLPPLSAVAPFLAASHEQQLNFLSSQQQAFVPFMSGANSAFRPFQQFPTATSLPSASWHSESNLFDTKTEKEVVQYLQPVTVNVGGASGKSSENVSREASPGSSTTHSSSPCSASTPLHHSLSGAVCVVCEDDKASGYHYGVISCEGCKGFFRRSVQKNMEYHCHKDGKCSVNRVTRNRCQACRFSKCLKTGMARESVRQDRNRKRKIKDEKEEAELRETARLQRTIQAVVTAHQETTVMLPLDKPFPSVPNYLTEQLLGNTARKSITDFCIRVPGFSELPDIDRNVLFRSAFLEIFLLRCAYICSGRNTSLMDFTTGLSDSHISFINLKDLVECVRKLRDSFLQLEVSNEEIALLSAVCLLCPTRVGLQNLDLVETTQEPVLEGLRIQVQLRRPHYQNVFAKLLMKISDLRTVAMRETVHLQNIQHLKMDAAL